MPRFPLYTGADIHGPYVEVLKGHGWDVMREVHVYPEGTDDPVHFERAVREGRVLVSNDVDQLVIALEWVRAGRAFPGLLSWRKDEERRMTAGGVLRAFEELAERENPLSPYAIIHLKTKD